MKAAGIIFITAGIALVILFAAEHFVVRPGSAESGGEYRDTPTVPVAEDPKVFDSQLEDWRSSLVIPRKTYTEDNPFGGMTYEEYNLAEAGSDYEYNARGGESLLALAKKFLGDANLVEELVKKNPSLLGRDKLELGEKIVIPFKERRK